ncbi:MAG: helix-turn-helix domain-containing protein, partial [Prevotella sp.]
MIHLTLKELRISKGMSQVECAKFLGMSTRNYQNYENNAEKAKTAKYHAIYQKLEVYGQNTVDATPTERSVEFRTRVTIGAG